MLGISLVWPKALVFEISITGSNPVSPAKFIRSVAQPGSALALGARGRRFESYYSDHKSRHHQRRIIGQMVDD